MSKPYRIDGTTHYAHDPLPGPRVVPREEAEPLVERIQVAIAAGTCTFLGPHD